MRQKVLTKGENIFQFFKFALVGVSNTAVDWIVFYFLTWTVFTEVTSEPYAKAIAFAFAVTNSFLWNSIWTFRREFTLKVGQGKSRLSSGSKLFVKFLVVSLVGLLVNITVFKFVRVDMEAAKIVGLIFASGSSIVWNYFANKFWTYKN